MSMMFMPGPGHPILFGLGLASAFAFWAGVVLLIVWGVRALMAHSAMSAASAQPVVAIRAPREILDERLAKGEITPEDYDRAKSALGGW